MKVSFVSLGCDKNLVDSEIMLGLIKEENHTIEDDYSCADIIVINTCGFIMDATQEGIDTILDLAEYKKNGSCKGLIVTGCMAQRYRDEIFNELPEVDAVVGTSDFDKIGEVIKNISSTEKINLVTSGESNIQELFAHKRVLSTGHYGYLKIAEGCNNRCTYCTIPSIRGGYKSRTMDTLIKEAKALSEKGLKELILVAQDTSLYGTDIYGEKKLHELMRELSKINGIEWIRLLYCYPEHVYDELIEEIKNNKKICKYIDMPIQHSHNRILKRMGRRSTEQELKEIIKKIRTIPNMSIRTTLIVGFPGETNEEFSALAKFIEDMKFDRLGVFKYSKEDGTPAAIMADQIDEDIKEERYNYIMEVQKKVSMEIFKKYQDTVVRVMVDGRLPEDDVYTGRMESDLIDVDGAVFFKCDYELYSGDFINVKITKTSDYDLMGVVYES
ncbi:MAG: 30S ribosomal protein S12 methylthiotransferase RimO [Lachnospirales bacterium]